MLFFHGIGARDAVVARAVTTPFTTILPMNTGFSAGTEMLKSLPARFLEKLELLGVPRRKALEYASLFVVLGGLYYLDLLRDYKEAACTPVRTVTPYTLFMIYLECFLCTAWPFAIVAGFDGTWRSKDAGNVFLAGYVAANVLWYRHTDCGFCIIGGAFRVIPLALGALTAHGIGARLNRLRNRE